MVVNVRGGRVSLGFVEVLGSNISEGFVFKGVVYEEIENEWVRR